MRKPTICICENKDADQLCSNCTADQRLFFFAPYIVQAGLCRTCAEPKLLVFSRTCSFNTVICSQNSAFGARFLNMHIFVPYAHVKHANDMQQLSSNEYYPLLNMCIVALSFSVQNEIQGRL